MTTEHIADYACYRRGCRRAECRDADRKYRKQAELRRLRGISGHIPGPTVAAHLRHVIDSGRQVRSIANETGVSERAIGYILNGQRNVTRPRALALLAVQPLTETPRIDPTGTIRRIQALAVIGWPIGWTAEQAGHAPCYLFNIIAGRVPAIPRDSARKIAIVYRQYSNRPGPSQYVRSVARRNGWHGPLAWDDIDDPNCQPEVDQANELELKRDDLAVLRRAEIEHLDAFNLSTHEIAARLGIAESTVQGILRELHSGQRRMRTNSERSAA